MTDAADELKSWLARQPWHRRAVLAHLRALECPELRRVVAAAVRHAAARECHEAALADQVRYRRAEAIQREHDE